MLPSAPLFVRPANGGRLPKLSPYLQSHYEEALGLSLTTTRLRSDVPACNALLKYNCPPFVFCLTGVSTIRMYPQHARAKSGASMKVLTATAVQLRNRYFIIFCKLLFLLTSCEQSYLKESRVQVGLRAANVQAKIRAVAMGMPSSSAAAAAAVDAVSGQLPLPTRAEVETAPLAAAPLSAASGQLPLSTHAEVYAAPVAATPLSAASGQPPLPTRAEVETTPLAAAPLSAASGQPPLPAHAEVDAAPVSAAPLLAASGQLPLPDAPTPLLSADVVVAGTRRKKTHKWAEAEVLFVRQWLLDGKSGDWVACLKAGQSVLHPNRTTIAVKDCARTLRDGGYKKSFGIEL